MLSSGLWEPFVTRVYQQALTFHHDAVVVDVGANIGYYTLLAAAMGHSVIAVEPQHENLRRLAEAARHPEYYGLSDKSDTSIVGSGSLVRVKTSEESKSESDQTPGSIVLLANAVSDRHKNVSLTASVDNQGGVRVLENCGHRGWPLASVLGVGRWYRHAQHQGEGSTSQQDCSVTTITMDDLVRVIPSSTVILKVDIGA